MHTFATLRQVGFCRIFRHFLVVELVIEPVEPVETHLPVPRRKHAGLTQTVRRHQKNFTVYFIKIMIMKYDQDEANETILMPLMEQQ